MKLEYGEVKFGILTIKPAPTMTPIRKLGTIEATTIMQLSTTAMQNKRSIVAYI